MGVSFRAGAKRPGSILIRIIALIVVIGILAIRLKSFNVEVEVSATGATRAKRYRRLGKASRSVQEDAKHRRAVLI